MRQGTEVKDSEQGVRSWCGDSGNTGVGLLYHLGESGSCIFLDSTGLALCVLSCKVFIINQLF